MANLRGSEAQRAAAAPIGGQVKALISNYSSWPLTLTPGPLTSRSGAPDFFPWCPSRVTPAAWAEAPSCSDGEPGRPAQVCGGPRPGLEGGALPPPPAVTSEPDRVKRAAAAGCWGWRLKPGAALTDRAHGTRQAAAGDPEVMGEAGAGGGGEERQRRAGVSGAARANRGSGRTGRGVPRRLPNARWEEGDLGGGRERDGTLRAPGSGPDGARGRHRAGAQVPRGRPRRRCAAGRTPGTGPRGRCARLRGRSSCRARSERCGCGQPPARRGPSPRVAPAAQPRSHGPERAGAAPLAAGEPPLAEAHSVHRVPGAAAGQHAAHRRGYVRTGRPPAPGTLPWAPPARLCARRESWRTHFAKPLLPPPPPPTAPIPQTAARG